MKNGLSAKKRSSATCCEEAWTKAVARPSSGDRRPLEDIATASSNADVFDGMILLAIKPVKPLARPRRFGGREVAFALGVCSLVATVVVESISLNS